LIKQFDPTIKRQTKRNICLDRHWDLPSLINDFYGEPIDWAATGIICLSLGSSVILTSRNGDINNISRSGSFETVASVKLHNNKLLCAAGTYYGCLEVYDLEKMRMIRCTRQSAMRIGCLTWSGNQLIAGGRDHSVRIFDLSMKNPLVKQYKQHKEQVGGVAIMNHILASGSDDKSVKIWDLRSDRVMHDLVGYNATIKALAWCPWRNNVLATGAGSEDGRIICWNLSSEPVKIDERNTESSVSCVLWNTHFREMISAHGRPFNCIGIWKYQHLGKPLVLLNGHRDRIMKVCIGPDNDMMCSVGADDALKFWKLDAQPEDIERVSLNRAIVR
jgi:WD40 repeat protein